MQNNSTTKTNGDRQSATQSEIETKMAEVGRQIAELERKAETAFGETRQDLDASIAPLREQESAAENKLAAMKQAADSAWDDLASGADAAVEELKRAYAKAAKRF